MRYSQASQSSPTGLNPYEFLLYYPVDHDDRANESVVETLSRRQALRIFHGVLFEVGQS